jgi:hypothetical protein
VRNKDWERTDQPDIAGFQMGIPVTSETNIFDQGTEARSTLGANAPKATIEGNKNGSASGERCQCGRTSLCALPSLECWAEKV